MTKDQRRKMLDAAEAECEGCFLDSPDYALAKEYFIKGWESNKKSWVNLTGEEAFDLVMKYKEKPSGLLLHVQQALKEKNT